MRRGNNTQLYNLIFPIWLIWLFPITWIVILPANFIVDLSVILLTLKFMDISDKKIIAKKVIIKVWLFGFLADFIGTGCLFMANIIDFNYETEFGRWWYENISNAVSFDPYSSIFAVLWILGSVLISACFIYFFNMKFSFRNSNLTYKARKRLALSLAVFTAPYLFFIPTAWIY